jgi:hypothetical protein
MQPHSSSHNKWPQAKANPQTCSSGLMVTPSQHTSIAYADTHAQLHADTDDLSWLCASAANDDSELRF